MPKTLPTEIPREPLLKLLVALADDELILGHRDSEWTGYGPILEEDIAFSNIAQDELGHSLALFGLHHELTGITPDAMAFERPWNQFTCSRFVTYPKGDFAYTVVRQYLFDEAEYVRMNSISKSRFEPLAGVARKILSEEAYHLMHSKGLLSRLGDATPESHQKMQAALDRAFPQSLGMFEAFQGEDELVKAGIIESSSQLRDQWLERTIPVLTSSSLNCPARKVGASWDLGAPPDNGGRTCRHETHLRELVEDLQAVYRTSPGPGW